MWCLRHGGNVYVDSLRNPHGCFTIHFTIFTALVHNAVSTALANQVKRDKGYILFQGPALMTSEPHVWSHCRRTCGPFILYMWYNATQRCCGVNSTTVFRYMANTLLYMDIDICRCGDDWTHTCLL